MKLLRDKTKKDVYMASKICAMIEREDLRDDHELQRKAGQWDNEVRDNFVVTVIQNEDFDPIKICEQLTENGVTLWLIDGLQRCTTIENYKAGIFALGKKINPAIIEYQEVKRDNMGKIIKDEYGNTVYEVISFDLRGKSYAQLPEQLKENFNNCPVDVVKHLACSDEEVGRHIVRYNSGSKMNTAQKTITYMHNVAKDIKFLSGHPFFTDCVNFSDKKDKNGTVDKIVNEAIMGLNFFDNWKRNSTQLGKFLNENATKEMFADFKEKLDRLYNITTPITGKLFSEKNALIWFMLFDKFTNSGLSDEKFGEFLNHFNELQNIKVTIENTRKPKGVEETNYLSFAEIDTCNSTKDKGMIKDKLHILEVVMKDFLHINEEKGITKEENIIYKKENMENNTQVKTESIFKNNEGEESVLEFVKQNVNSNITDEDIDVCYDTVDYCKNKLKGFNKNSKLLDYHNETALISIIVYAMKNNIDLDQWIVELSNRNITYLENSKENYIYMRNNLNDFIKMQKGVIA